MEMSEEGKIVLRTTANTKEYVNDHWKDSFGAQYSLWLEQTSEKLQQMERQREVLHLRKEKITLLCESVAADDNDPPKTRKRTL